MTRSEIYISVDIEASGPVPPKYSMLSVGACVVGNPSMCYYAELKPLSSATDPEAMKVVRRPLQEFERGGVAPERAVRDFREWIIHVSADKTPVFVGFNAVFDWAFLNWYFLHFLGENPFGPGGIDIKSFYMGQAGVTWEDTRSGRIPLELKGNAPETHHALEDAVRQAGLFQSLLSRASIR